MACWCLSDFSGKIGHVPHMEAGRSSKRLGLSGISMGHSHHPCSYGLCSNDCDPSSPWSVGTRVVASRQHPPRSTSVPTVLSEEFLTRPRAYSLPCLSRLGFVLLCSALLYFLVVGCITLQLNLDVPREVNSGLN